MSSALPRTTHSQPASGPPHASPAPVGGQPSSALPWRDLTPLCVMVFAEFLAMGLPLPLLPTHVHQTLGFSTFVVGVVIGAQSWVTLLTRHVAGTRSDQMGPRSAAVLGLLVSALAGGVSALSAALPNETTRLATLLVGRGLLGLGESLVVTGALAWGVALAGRERTGIVMAWTGIAMYGALAAGSPLGAALEARVGFVGVLLVAGLAPVAGLVAAFTARTVAPMGGSRLPFHHVLKHLLLPGAGLSLAAVGFGAIAAFSTLFFAERGWSGATLAMGSFGAAYVVARLFLGGLPDRLGGARVAALSAALVVGGQLGMWLATSAVMAIAAAALTGFGFSLAFPSFGVEAMRQVPAQSRGVALGAYAACFDATMGVGVPLLGLLVGSFGYASAYAVGSAAAVISLLIALWLAFGPREQRS